MAREKMAAISKRPSSSKRISEAHSGRVAGIIRSFVLDGVLAPGERINELALSGKLEVSRTPIRAALQALVGERLVEYQHNKGYFVRQFDVSEMYDAFEVRALTEGLAARLAAERGLSSEDEIAIEQSLQMAADVLELSDVEEARLAYSSANEIFHGVIQRAAKAPIVSDVIAICYRIPQTFTKNVMAFSFEEVPPRLAMHQQIYEAILGRRPKEAEQSMFEHVISIRRSIAREALLKNRD